MVFKISTKEFVKLWCNLTSLVDRHYRGTGWGVSQGVHVCVGGGGGERLSWTHNDQLDVVKQNNYLRPGVTGGPLGHDRVGDFSLVLNASHAPSCSHRVKHSHIPPRDS